MSDTMHRIVVRAALGSGPEAVEAYHRWRDRILLDDIDWPTHRLLPLLAATARRHNIVDKDRGRIEGAAKHIWVSNTLRLNSLVAAVKALKAAKVPCLLLKGAALFARDPEQLALRATGDYDILVPEADKRRAISALIDAGFHPVVFRSDAFTDEDFERLHAAPFERPGASAAQRGQIDLHWKPSGELPLPGLSDLLFANADTVAFEGIEVLVPDVADHLFVGLTHMDSSNTSERTDWFVEAAQIIRNAGESLRWSHVQELCVRYSLSGRAARFLSLLNDCLPGLVPTEEIAIFERNEDLLERLEFGLGYGLSGRPSVRRSVFATLRDRPPGTRLPVAGALSRAARDGMLRLPAGPTISLQCRFLWRYYARRGGSNPGRAPHFWRGWSAAEESGRWSNGTLAVIRMAADAPVVLRLRLRAFIPTPRSVIGAGFYAGAEYRSVTFHAGLAWPQQMALTATPVDGVVTLVIRIPRPLAPIDFKLSDDVRRLGLFVESVAVD